jgi:hypothetical protein
MRGNVIYSRRQPGVPRTAWRAAPSRDPGSSTKLAAQRLIFREEQKNWIPDLRGGFATACPGHEAEDVIYERNVIYGESE